MPSRTATLSYATASAPSACECASAVHILMSSSIPDVAMVSGWCGWGSTQFRTCESPCSIRRSLPSRLDHTNRWPQSLPDATNSSSRPRKLTPFTVCRLRWPAHAAAAYSQHDIESERRTRHDSCAPPVCAYACTCVCLAMCCRLSRYQPPRQEAVIIITCRLIDSCKHIRVLHTCPHERSQACRRS